MKKGIHVHTAFTFTHPNGTTTRFNIAQYMVDEWIADHWFTQAHSSILPNVAPITQSSKKIRK